MEFGTLDFLIRCGKEFGHKRIRDCGFTDTEFMICSFVYFHPLCSQDEAVQGLRMDKTTVAKASQALEKRKLLERVQSSEDRRRKELCLSAEAKSRIGEIVHLHDQWLSELLFVLTPEEQKEFESSCMKLLAAAEQRINQERQDMGEKRK